MKIAEVIDIPSWKRFKPNKDATTKRVGLSAGDNQASHAHISYGPSKGIANMNSKDGLQGRSKESFARLNVNGKMIESETQKSAELRKRKRRVVSDKVCVFTTILGEFLFYGYVSHLLSLNSMFFVERSVFRW